MISLNWHYINPNKSDCWFEFEYFCFHCFEKNSEFNELLKKTEKIQSKYFFFQQCINISIVSRYYCENPKWIISNLSFTHTSERYLCKSKYSQTLTKSVNLFELSILYVYIYVEKPKWLYFFIFILVST